MVRARHLALMVLLAFMVLFSLSYILSSNHPANPLNRDVVGTSSGLDKSGSSSSFGEFGLSDNILHGDSIAPRLENATAKAELGRATWKFLHTMMARYPENPTEDDQTALRTFMHLFGRLYPCGQCAEHFRMMLQKYPPQTSSRNAAAGWACFVHNIVNERIHKPEFDCNTIGDFYDCGCGDEDKDQKTEGEINVELNREG
ncbi:hypothetical protein MKZ38_003143 [Zalerion maritima]|uniref:Sulfhydryl oxidase n=1 Tax=Zalerion maritima TaxID=339359 RepID=A0AAD5WWP8_9PEZI|nr:hypothetical protein MKZ38_003143 [Zalerion maritima]